MEQINNLALLLNTSLGNTAILQSSLVNEQSRAISNEGSLGASVTAERFRAELVENTLTSVTQSISSGVVGLAASIDTRFNASLATIGAVTAAQLTNTQHGIAAQVRILIDHWPDM